MCGINSTPVIDVTAQTLYVIAYTLMSGIPDLSAFCPQSERFDRQNSAGHRCRVAHAERWHDLQFQRRISTAASSAAQSSGIIPLGSVHPALVQRGSGIRHYLRRLWQFLRLQCQPVAWLGFGMAGQHADAACGEPADRHASNRHGELFLVGHLDVWLWHCRRPHGELVFFDRKLRQRAGHLRWQDQYSRERGEARPATRQSSRHIHAIERNFHGTHRIMTLGQGACSSCRPSPVRFRIWRWPPANLERCICSIATTWADLHRAAPTTFSTKKQSGLAGAGRPISPVQTGSGVSSAAAAAAAPPPAARPSPKSPSGKSRPRPRLPWSRKERRCLSPAARMAEPLRRCRRTAQTLEPRSYGRRESRSFPAPARSIFMPSRRRLRVERSSSCYFPRGPDHGPTPAANANIVPVVANGKVYVASNKQLTIFGLGGHAFDAPAAAAAQPAARNTQSLRMQSPGFSNMPADRCSRSGPAPATIARVDDSEALRREQIGVLVPGQCLHGPRNPIIRTARCMRRPSARAKGSPAGWPPDR